MNVNISWGEVFMTNMDRILNSAKTDAKLQMLIGNCLNRAGYPQYAISGLMFKEEKSDSPAFSLGFQLWNYPIGAIFVGENLSSFLTDDELEFVVLHELCHIIQNHSIASSLIWLGKSIVIDFLADVFEVSKKRAQEYLGVIKALYMLFRSKKTIEEEAKAQIELEADKYAVNIQRQKDPAISTLVKLSNGNIRAPTHVTIDGRFPFPIITYEERIEAIKRI